LKTSTLIQKLTEISKTVPFDADVVTGEDWWPHPITRVYHNPPHTFIEFGTEEPSENEDPDEFTLYKELEIRTNQMMIIRDFVKSNIELKPDEIINELNTQIDRLRLMAEAILTKY
jgi:hypothetical protein